MDPGQANVGAGGVLIFGVDGTLHRSPTPTRYYKPPLPLSSVRPSSAPPVLISDEPRLCRASPPPFKVCNLRIPWGRTHSNSLLCPAAAVLALSGIRPSALWVGSPRRGSGDPRMLRWRDRHEISRLVRDFSAGVVFRQGWTALSDLNSTGERSLTCFKGLLRGVIV
jgi:hypothetical protein